MTANYLDAISTDMRSGTLQQNNAYLGEGQLMILCHCQTKRILMAMYPAPTALSDTLWRIGTLPRATSGNGKRDSDMEESTESPNVLLFIRRLVAERPRGDDESQRIA